MWARCVCVSSQRYIQRECFPSWLYMASEVDALSPSEQRCYAGCLCAFPERKQFVDPLLVAGDDSEWSCFCCLLWMPVFEFRGVFLLLSSRLMIRVSLFILTQFLQNIQGKHESLPEGYFLMSRGCRCFCVVHVWIISSLDTATDANAPPPPPPRVLSLLMCVIDS